MALIIGLESTENPPPPPQLVIGGKNISAFQYTISIKELTSVLFKSITPQDCTISEKAIM